MGTRPKIGRLHDQVLKEARLGGSFDRQPMNNDEHDAYGIFRRIGSRGLVVFERDGILLKQDDPSRDIMLGDISNELFELLKQLREQEVRFGFISNDRGMNAGSRGGAEFAALTNVLDRLLGIGGAKPDFWMVSHTFPYAPERAGHDRYSRRWIFDAGVILKAAEWYGVGRKETVLVSSSTDADAAAKDADITRIQYFGPQNDQVVLPRIRSETGHTSPSDSMQIERVYTQIKQVLGLGNCQTA
nr:hypothetical protein RP007_04900 [Rhizobium sp. P007]